MGFENHDVIGNALSATTQDINIDFCEEFNQICCDAACNQIGNLDDITAVPNMTSSHPYMMLYKFNMYAYIDFGVVVLPKIC